MPTSKPKHLTLDNWTVDYGDGHPEPVCVPHAWAQDVSVCFEGPVVYRANLEVPLQPCHLVFWGVSYAARVTIDGNLEAEHRGIWDAFSVPLAGYRGKSVAIEVSVVKNGGSTYPVRDVASGFLPYVFNTFGGMYGEVEIVMGDQAPIPTQASPPRASVHGGKIFLDGKPFYPRGVLTWGWYPDTGHTNPSADIIRKEVREAKALGFNLIKFCLWVPPHRYLEILREEGMEAWLELPLWDPSPNPEHQSQMAEEIERIVRQYRRHDNIVVWTVGCELSASTTAAYREYLYKLVKNLTGSPLVKDNSGGAEMYGGDLREFGDFYDFHPYCDTEFYASVLDSLLPGPRPEGPVLLGEFNDVDAHRDLAHTKHDMAFWASTMQELNDKGVRWSHVLPGILANCPFAKESGQARHRSLLKSSREKALFVRKTVQELVRAREAIGGYVVTNLRDTPISTAGLIDDWGKQRFSRAECLPWNGPDVLFLIPTRRPPWVDGGNRPGYRSMFSHFAGQVLLRVGLHSEAGARGGLIWSVRDSHGAVVARGLEDSVAVGALSAAQIATIHWHCEEPGSYELGVEYGNCANRWPLYIATEPDAAQWTDWGVYDPPHVLDDLRLTGSKHLIAMASPPDLGKRLSAGSNVLMFSSAEGTVRLPFWRECAQEFENEAFWEGLDLAGRWERLLDISPDCALDPDWLGAHVPKGYETEILMNRVDVRTYIETPLMIRAKGAGGTLIATTLRPFGGLGSQPTSITRNPVGFKLFEDLLRILGSA